MQGLLIGLVLALAAAGPAPQTVIVDFERGLDPDQAARELCLRFRCTVRHVYRYVPGAALTGGNLAALPRAPGVTNVTPDLPIDLEPGAHPLVGAPSHAPLVVIGGGLDGGRLILERRLDYAGDLDPRARETTTDLVAALARRMPTRQFWAVNVIGADARGRLSDFLAALEDVAALRFAVAGVYAPLRLDGEPPPRLCRMTDEVLRKGLLVITPVDEGCRREFP